MAALEAVNGIPYVCEHSAVLCKLFLHLHTVLLECFFFKMKASKYCCLSFFFSDPAAGDASDFYYNLGARFAYLIELRDQGYEFTLPPRFIKPSGAETWEGFKVILNEL